MTKGTKSKKAVLSLRLTEETRDRVVAAARAEGRSIAEMAEIFLDMASEMRGLDPVTTAVLIQLARIHDKVEEQIGSARKSGVARDTLLSLWHFTFDSFFPYYPEDDIDLEVQRARLRVSDACAALEIKIEELETVEPKPVFAELCTTHMRSWGPSVYPRDGSMSFYGVMRRSTGEFLSADRIYEVGDAHNWLWRRITELGPERVSDIPDELTDLTQALSATYRTHGDLAKKKGSVLTEAQAIRAAVLNASSRHLRRWATEDE